MTTQITTLANGLRVASHAMPHLETVSLGIWVGAGARHETDAEHGLCHFLEHMAFKGTRLRSARQIAEEIEEVGGDLNAATSLEMTAYYARVLKGDEGVALNILADILQNSIYADDDLEREREVILQEIAGIKDSPDELAYDLIQEAAFPEQPVGRPIIGTPDSVGRHGAANLRAFLETCYGGPRMVLSAAGAIRHEDLVRHAEALFGRLTVRSRGGTVPARYVGGVRFSEKPFEQGHLLVAFKGPSYRDADYFTAQVFSGLMGGGMSSRLFQEVRENRGLCYSIYSSAWGLCDSGMFAIHAATGADVMRDLIDVVVHEVKRAAAEAPGSSEVARAKAQLKAGLLMSLESSGARAEQMARQLLAHDRIIPPAELVARVDAVTAEGICRFAAKLVGSGVPSIAVVGAGARSAERAGQVRDLMAA